MKKIIFCIIIFILFSFLHKESAQAAVGISFGGRVVSIQPCNTGLLAYLKTSKGPLSVMWFWGNLPFPSYIPPHPGQQLLGKISPTPTPCVLGYVPYGAGFPILYHGSSI